MFKYFYITEKIIYTSNLFSEILIENNNNELSINHTAKQVRDLVKLYHRNLVTVLNEQSNMLYYINVNTIDRIFLNDNLELQIIFDDNTELIFTFDVANQTEFIYRYIKAVYNGNNLSYYKRNRNIFYVHADFSNENNSYNNIQGCIDAMNTGDYMYVYAGTYNESITIDKSIDIEFAEDTTLNAGSQPGITIEESVHVNIFGLVNVTSDNAVVSIANGSDSYIEFDSMTSSANWNIAGYQGNLIMKGTDLISTSERNMFEFSEDKCLMDILNIQSYTNDNIHCNGLNMTEQYSLTFTNVRFESPNYSFNIEHAEGEGEIAMTVNFFNCLFYVNSSLNGSISTHTGGTINPVNLNMHSCYIDTPVNTNEDVYTFISENNYGKLNINYLSHAYGKHGTTSESEGLYITEGNGKEFIIDSEINIADIL